MPPPEGRDLHLEEAACRPETATLPVPRAALEDKKAKEAINQRKEVRYFKKNKDLKYQQMHK